MLGWNIKNDVKTFPVKDLAHREQGEGKFYVSKIHEANEFSFLPQIKTMVS